MKPPLWFDNVAVYSAQLAVVIAAGGLMATVTCLRLPRVRLIYWRIVLVAGLLLPVIEPWRAVPWVRQSAAQAGQGIAPVGSIQIEASVAVARTRPVLSVYDWIAIALAAAILLRLLWLAAGWLRLHRSRRSARALGPQEAVEEFQSALGVFPSVLISDQIASPATFGWRQPVIVLPPKFLQMDAARQRVILCHEFLHVRRRDWLWHVGEEILRALFWFHPAVAWLISQLRLTREQAVDQEVVALAGSRRDYLAALYEIASATSAARLAPAPLFLAERHLKRRVALILKEVSMSRKNLALALSASLAGLSLTATLAAALLPLRTSAAAPAVPAAPAQTESRSSVNRKDRGRTVKVDQAGLQRQLQQAAAQARAAERAAAKAAKIDQAKIRAQLEQAMAQARQQAQAALARANLQEQQQLERQRQTLEKQREQLEEQRRELEKQRRELQIQLQELDRERRELEPQRKPARPAPPESAPASPKVPTTRRPPNSPSAAGAAGGISGGGPRGIKGGVASGSQSPKPKLKPVSQPQPVYPPLAKARHIQGTVHLWMTVNPQGEVVGVQVISGQPLLAKASVAAVRQWRFEPPGKTVKAKVETTFRMF